MNMVTVIGYHVSGIPARSCAARLLSAVVHAGIRGGKFWDHFEGSPWRDSVQRGMAPITIGLMMSGAYAIGRTATINFDHSMRHNLITVAITMLVTLILLMRHVNMAILILAGGAVGWFALRMF